MDTLQRTKTVLAEAEKALATLASEAATGTQYETASCLIDTAREVNDLADRTLRRLQAATHERAQSSPSPESSGKNKPTVAQMGALRKGKSRKGAYPKFLRQGDELVKVGWSPTEKAEYEHKCPKRILPLVALTIGKAGANGRRFAMDRVMPVLDPTDGRRIPDYQVYLCLAWFRELGFVIQHGRQGYSLASKASVEPLIETHWAQVPVR
jgi:hypothetical protein